LDLIVVTDRLEAFKNSFKIKKGRDLGTNAINSERRQASAVPVQPGSLEHNIHYAKSRIRNFEAFRDAILRKLVADVAAFDPVPSDPAVCPPLGLL